MASSISNTDKKFVPAALPEPSQSNETAAAIPKGTKLKARNEKLSALADEKLKKATFSEALQFLASLVQGETPLSATEEVEFDQANKQAGLLIPSIKWFPQYEYLDVENAVLLHLLTAWKTIATEGKADEKDKALITKLLFALAARPFDPLNKNLFDSFKRKMSLPSQQHLKDCHALSFLSTSPCFKKRLMFSLLPSDTRNGAIPFNRKELATYTLTTILFFAKTVLSLSNNVMQGLEYGDLNDGYKALNGILQLKRANLESVITDSKRLALNCSARKKDIEDKIDFLTLQPLTEVAPTKLQYYVQYVYSRMQLLIEQAENCIKSFNDLPPELDSFFPKKDVYAILQEAYYYTLDDDPAITYREPASFLDTLGSGKEKKIDDLMSTLFSREMVKKNKQPKFSKEFQKLQELLKENPGITDCEYLQKKVQLKFNCTQSEIDLLFANAKIYYRQIRRYKAHLDIFYSGLAILRLLIDKYSFLWLEEGDSKKAPMPDLDALWPEFHDDIPEEIETLTPTAQSSIDIQSAEKEEESAVEFAPASAAATAVMQKPAGTLMQRMLPLRKAALSFSPSTQNPLVVKLSNADAAFHLGLLASTVSLLQHAEKSSKGSTYISQLMKRVVRSSAIGSELIYTSRSSAKTISHSHVEMEQSAKLADNARIKNFLQKIDYGSVSSRYPEGTMERYVHRKLPFPKTLLWCLGKEKYQFKDLFELAEDAVHFFEHAAGQPHQISEMMKKESAAQPAAAAASAHAFPIQKLLKEPINDLSIIINKIHSKIKGLNEPKDALSIQIQKTWKRALTRLNYLKDALQFWIAYPQAEHFASHADDVLLALQLQDEIVEEAVHLTLNKKMQRSHKLIRFRELRAYEFEKNERAALYDLDIGPGAQYVHRYQYILKHRKKDPIAPKQQPKALSWRLDALEVSMNSEAYDSGMTPAGRKIDYADLQRQIIQKIGIMLSITKKTLSL